LIKFGTYNVFTAFFVRIYAAPLKTSKKKYIKLICETFFMDQFRYKKERNGDIKMRYSYERGK